MDPTFFKEYGLLGLMCGAVITLLFLIVKWTLSTTKEILSQANSERECWRQTIATANQSLQKICDCLDDHDKKAEERGKYVREEHRQMIESLGRINGYKHE